MPGPEIASSRLSAAFARAGERAKSGPGVFVSPEGGTLLGTVLEVYEDGDLMVQHSAGGAGVEIASPVTDEFCAKGSRVHLIRDAGGKLSVLGTVK